MFQDSTDNNTTHLLPPNVPPCPAHAAGIASGSSTVKVNGKGCGRVGDSISLYICKPVKDQVMSWWNWMDINSIIEIK